MQKNIEVTECPNPVQSPQDQTGDDPDKGLYECLEDDWEHSTESGTTRPDTDEAASDVFSVITGGADIVNDECDEKLDGDELAGLFGDFGSEDDEEHPAVRALVARSNDWLCSLAHNQQKVIPEVKIEDCGCGERDCDVCGRAYGPATERYRNYREQRENLYATYGDKTKDSFDQRRLHKEQHELSKKFNDITNELLPQRQLTSRNSVPGIVAQSRNSDLGLDNLLSAEVIKQIAACAAAAACAVVDKRLPGLSANKTQGVVKMTKNISMIGLFALIHS